MNKYDRAEEIMENYETGLVFPFHINHALRESSYFYNENYTEFHDHDFHSIIVKVWSDPKAFYLTEEDKEYYSKQELEVIENIQKKNKL